MIAVVTCSGGPSTNHKELWSGVVVLVLGLGLLVVVGVALAAVVVVGAVAYLIFPIS